MNLFAESQLQIQSKSKHSLNHTSQLSNILFKIISTKRTSLIKLYRPSEHRSVEELSVGDNSDRQTTTLSHTAYTAQQYMMR